MSRDWLSSVSVIDVTIYTSSLRCSGQLRSQQARVSDFLNTLTDDYLLVFDAIVEPLYAPTGTQPVRMQFVQIRRDSIVMVLPVEAKAGRERRPEMVAVQVHKDQHPVILEAYPFALRGTIHVAPGLQIKEHIHDPFARFMPVTEAGCTYLPNRRRDFQAPVVLLNKSNLQVLMIREQVAQAWAEAVREAIRRHPISAEEALGILQRSPVFGGVDAARLRELTADLVRQTLIDGKECQPNTVIFEQGDTGDTMYVIESGSVEILLMGDGSAPPRKVAELGPGDFFGEMAVLGDRLRTATARTTGLTRLLAIHETALTAILSTFPPVAGHLLRVMAERRGIITTVRGGHGQAGSAGGAPAATFQPSRRKVHDPKTIVAEIVGDKLKCWNCSGLNDLDDVFCTDCGVRLAR